MNWFIYEWMTHSDPAHNHYNGYWKITNAKPPFEIGQEIKIENAMGGYHYHIINDMDSFLQSTWEKIETKRFLNNQDSNYGWINKNGIFYGCDYEEHAYCIYRISGLHEDEAERAGWIKIYRDPLLANYCPDRSNGTDCVYYYDSINSRLTKAQKDTLLSRGFNI